MHVDDTVAVLVRDITEEREHLDLLRDRDLQVFTTRSIEVAQRRLRKSADLARKIREVLDDI